MPDSAATESEEEALPLRTMTETVAFGTSALGAAAFLGLAVWLGVAAAQLEADPVAPHGGAFQLLGALLCLGPGSYLAVSALAFWRRWRVRWALFGLGIVSTAVLALLAVGG